MKVLLADEVAELLRVPVPRIYELARQGQIPHMRLGRQVRFRQEAVEAWLNTLEDLQEKTSLHSAWPKAGIA